MGTSIDLSKQPHGENQARSTVIAPHQVPAVAAKTEAAFGDYAGQRGGYQSIPGHKDNARVINGPVGQEVWVKSEYGGYRAAFQAVHGQQPSGTGPSGVHIDHAFARSGAQRLDVEWVLVGASMGGVNSAHGWAREARIRDGVTSADVPPIVYASPVQMQKVLGAGPAGEFITRLSQPVGSQLTRREANRLRTYVTGYND